MGDLYPTSDVDNVATDNDIVFFFISSHSVFETRLFHFAIVSVHKPYGMISVLFQNTLTLKYNKPLIKF